MDEHWRSVILLLYVTLLFKNLFLKNNDMRVLIVEILTTPIAGYIRVVNASSRDEEKV